MMEYVHSAPAVQKLEESLGQLPEPVLLPVLIAVVGLPGTGKSYFCGRLAERLPFVVLESDALRKVLFPSPSYNPQESTQLFQAIHLLIEKLLRKGIPLILDATNLSEKHREHLYSIADRLGIKLILVRVDAPPEVVYERLTRRQQRSESKSDADWTIYQKMQSYIDNINRKHYVVDTSQDITPFLDKIVRDLRQ